MSRFGFRASGLIVLAMLLLVIVVWVTSASWAYIVRTQNGGILVGAGEIEIGWGPGRWFGDPGWLRRVRTDWGFEWPRLWRLGPGIGMVEVPLWLPTTIPLAACGVLVSRWWRRFMRRRVKDRCVGCGYD